MSPNIQTETTQETQERLDERSINTMKSTIETLTEMLPYFELAGHRLERHDHGMPECPEITINPQDASGSVPQAWSEEVDEKEYWFYNYLGAMTEAKYLGREIPTIDQWLEMFGKIEGGAKQKARILGVTSVGYRNAYFGTFIKENDIMYRTAAPSPEHTGVRHSVILEDDYASPDLYPHSATYDDGHGFPVRFFWKKK